MKSIIDQTLGETNSILHGLCVDPGLRTCLVVRAVGLTGVLEVTSL